MARRSRTSKKPKYKKPQYTYFGSANMSRMPHPNKFNKVFPFDQLPTELREVVYEEMLAGHKLNIVRDSKEGRFVPKSVTCRTGVNFRYPMYYSDRRRIFPNRALSILRVNKAISAEALSVLYGRNEFKFWDMKVMRDFMEMIQGNISLLREVSLEAHGCIILNIKHLWAIENLKSMEISLPSTGGDHSYINHLCAALRRFIARKEGPEDQAEEASKISFVADGGFSPAPGIAWSSEEAPEKMKGELLRRLRHPKTPFKP